jgi:hypothetical protein
VPPLHFCGHYHEPGGPLEAPPGTASYLLNAVGFLRPNRLNPGGFGVLRWAEPTDRSFALVEAPSLDEYTRSNFRYL